MGLEPSVRETLTQRQLLPGPPPPEIQDVWPTGTVEAAFARGCLLAGAAGDALGRPAEGRPAWKTRERHGRLRDFLPSWDWESGPIGTFTDDTQLTIWTAESLLDPEPTHQEAFANVLAERHDDIRGIGFATGDAITRLEQGTPWHEAGSRSAGNGAAMRAAPFGIAYGHDPATLREVAALNAVVTHADPLAVASTIIQAGAVAYLLATPPGSLEPERFFDWLVASAADLHDPGHRERRAGTDATLVRLVDRIGELREILDAGPRDAFALTYNAPSSSNRYPPPSGASCITPRTSKKPYAPPSPTATTPTPSPPCAATWPAPTSAKTPSPRRWLDELEDADRSHVPSGPSRRW